MDIHFCDLCGVRVADVDLRGGHGIRKQYDVICATCLELGHGKEWLAGHQRGKPAAVASQPARAALAATASNKQAPVITQARDRVQTFEDGDDSPSVAPQVLAAEESEDGIATGELENGAVSAEAEAAAKAAAEASKEQANNQFAAAASSFSALAATPKKVDAAADVEDGTDRGEGLSDESTAAPILADKQAEDSESDHGSGESPFGFSEDSRDHASQKDETLPADREPLVSGNPTGDKKKPLSGSAAFKKSAANNQASNGKSSKSKSAKGPAKRGRKNKNTLMLSLLSAGILLMIGLIVVQANKTPQKPQEHIKVDLSENVRTAIKDAKFKATQAINSGGVDELIAARTQIQAIVPEIGKFEKIALAQKPPWTMDQMGQYLQDKGWNDVNSLIITINQKIARLKAPGGSN